jgi:hypothetical protein
LSRQAAQRLFVNTALLSASKPSRFLEARPRSVALILCGYIAVHFALRLVLPATLGIDDAEQALFAQQWLPSYRYRAPPLFTWMLMPVFAVVGVNALALAIVRYVLLAAAAAFTYMTARRLIRDPRLAALATFSPAAIYVVAYYSHHDLTHTTALTTLIAITWYVFVRLAERPTLAWYIALGIAFGLGVLAKWNFAVLAAALPLACLVRPETRGLVLNPRVLVAGLIAALVAGPTALWVAAMQPPAGESVATVLGQGSGFLAILRGSFDLLLALLVYPQPFLILFLLVFRRALGRGWIKARGARSGLLATIGDTMLIAAVLHLLLVVAFGATEFSERMMQPALQILPIYLFMLVERGEPEAEHEPEPEPEAVGIFASILLGLALVTLAARVIVVAAGGDYCGKCRAVVPFEAIAQGLREAGFSGRGTVLVADFHVGGNLRVQFPEARIVYTGAPKAIWPPPKGDGACLLAWPTDMRGAPEDMAAYLRSELGGAPDPTAAIATVTAPMPRSARRYSLSYQLYTAGVGECR